MIRDFKARIFCYETNLAKRETDMPDPIWIDRIDTLFRQNSQLPPDGDPSKRFIQRLGIAESNIDCGVTTVLAG